MASWPNIEGQTLAEVIHDLRQLQESGSEQADRKDISTPESLALAGGLTSGRFAAGKLGSDDVTRGHTAGAGGSAEPAAAGSQTLAETQRDVQAATPTQLSTRSPTYFRSIAEFGTQAAEALDHAHEEGVIHRDIKPSNHRRLGS